MENRPRVMSFEDFINSNQMTQASTLSEPSDPTFEPEPAHSMHADQPDQGISLQMMDEPQHEEDPEKRDMEIDMPLSQQGDSGLDPLD